MSPPPRDITLLHSYASDNKRRTFCADEAASPRQVRTAAGRNDLPADRVTRVQVLGPYVAVPHVRLRRCLARVDPELPTRRPIGTPMDAVPIAAIDVLGQTPDLDGMDHKDAQFIYNGFGVLARPPLQGLISLSPCEDGTLVAAVVHRTVHKKQYEERTHEVNDEWAIQTAPYEIDIVKGTVSPGPWTKIPGEALHVQKLPMPGWPLFSSLIAKLSYVSALAPGRSRV